MQRKNRWIGLLIVLAVVLTSVAVSADDDDGYKTPEDVAAAFVQAVADNDADDVLDTFGIEQRVARFDLSKLVQVKGGYAIGINPPAPNNSEMFRELNEHYMQGQAARSIYVFCASFFADMGELTAQSAYDADDAWAREMGNRVNPVQLKGLAIESVAESAEQGSKNLREEFAKRAAAYSVDEVVGREIVYTLDGKRFRGGMQFFRIGEQWFIDGLWASRRSGYELGAVTRLW